MTTFLYNPDRKPKVNLIGEFVVRTDMYEEIMQDLETSKMRHPEQHYLLVGQRGAGKTTLLNRIKYAIEDSVLLKEDVIPVLFNEEQYHISELVNLWENIAQYLEDYHHFDGLYDQVEANLAKPNFEELSYDILENALKANKKKLVLLIDNIGDLLKKLEKTEVHRLREVLQTSPHIRLIAGSPFYLETVLDYHQPFFEFFKVLRLDGLNQKETQHLLLKLAEVHGEEQKIKNIIDETPERIETLRTLTGGMPRIIGLMFNIFVEFNNKDTVKDLEKILDAVTPLYKHRMDDLPAQQQKIVDAVARNWDGISVKELKGKLRMESKIISAQLRQLEKNQIIEIIDTNTKNHLYFLKERFFNIWYLMRYGRKYDRQRVIWLVKFLESWCTTNEIEERIVDYVQKIQEGRLHGHLVDFYGEVYTGIKDLRARSKFILKEGAPDHLTQRIELNDSELVSIIQEEIEKGKFEKVLSLIQNIKEPDDVSSRILVLGLFHLITDDFETFSDALKPVLEKLKGNEENELQYFEYLILLSYLNYNCLSQLVAGNEEAAHNGLKTLVYLSSQHSGVFEATATNLVDLSLFFFLMFNQENIALSIFQQFTEWKDKLKPTYYTVHKLLKNDSEVIKMTSEIEEKVNEMVARIISVRKDYYEELSRMRNVE